MLAFEAEVSRLLLARSDVNYRYGQEVDFQFQHRLWRYGPNFDPKAKGGIWHKDTCPFGINGVLPDGSTMFTIVYILFTENLDGPTSLETLPLFNSSPGPVDASQLAGRPSGRPASLLAWRPRPLSTPLRS